MGEYVKIRTKEEFLSVPLNGEWKLSIAQLKVLVSNCICLLYYNRLEGRYVIYNNIITFDFYLLLFCSQTERTYVVRIDGNFFVPPKDGWSEQLNAIYGTFWAMK